MLLIISSHLCRYADIIVHRLLAVAIGADSTYPELTDKHKLADMCKNLNYRHKMAQYAQRASVAFHTQVSSSEMWGGRETRCIVAQNQVCRND